MLSINSSSSRGETSLPMLPVEQCAVCGDDATSNKFVPHCIVRQFQLVMICMPGNTGRPPATPAESSSTGRARRRRRRAAAFVAIARSIDSLAPSAGRDDADDAITSLAPDHPSYNCLCASILNLHNITIGEVPLFEKAGSLILFGTRSN